MRVKARERDDREIKRKREGESESERGSDGASELPGWSSLPEAS